MSRTERCVYVEFVRGDRTALKGGSEKRVSIEDVLIEDATHEQLDALEQAKAAYLNRYDAIEEHARAKHRDNRAAFNKSIAAAAIYDYEYRIRRKEWSAQRLDDAARETEEP